MREEEEYMMMFVEVIIIVVVVRTKFNYYRTLQWLLNFTIGVGIQPPLHLNLKEMKKITASATALTPTNLHSLLAD